MKRIAGLFIVLSATLAQAQFTNTSSVLDGSGTISSGGSFTNLSAAGQPGGIAVSQGGGFVNQAGFLNTFFLKPGLDSDGDGLANEADQDNDNDGLADTAEIGGGAFAPNSLTDVNNADSDGDGMTDGQEADAGTNPTNINESLEIVSIANVGGGRDVRWLARGNTQRTYVVRTAPDAKLPYSTVVFSNTVAGGTPPWYVVTNTLSDATPANAELYSVEARP